MKSYIKPSIEVTEFDNENIIMVSSVNINGNNIKKADSINDINWHGQMK